MKGCCVDLETTREEGVINAENLAYVIEGWLLQELTRGARGQIFSKIDEDVICVKSLWRIGVDVLGVVLEGVDALQGLPADGAGEAPLGPRHDGVARVDGFCT